MKEKSRFLSLLISLALMLVLLPAAVFADTDTDISNAVITNCTVSKVYTGKLIRQEPVLVLADRTLVAGEDYSVSYKNNKNVGTATVTITGKGAYTGSVKKTFRIIPKGSSITNTSRGYHYVKLTWSKRALKMSKSRITGYRVRYSKKSDMSNSKVKVFKGYTKTSAKISGLAEGTKYYFQVRTYKIIGKNTYYSNWSAPKQVTTKSYNTANKYVYRCVKAGNNVYCSAGGSIYKVNVKTNKKTLFKKTNGLSIDHLAIHNGYLYYIKDFYYEDKVQYPLQLCRISLSTKETSMVVPAIDYYFDGGRIYYASYKPVVRYDDGEAYDSYEAGNWMSMKSDGTDKSDTGLYGKRYAGKVKACNVTNYSIRTKEGGAYKEKIYLRKPNKKTIYLATVNALMGIPHEWTMAYIDNDPHFFDDY